MISEAGAISASNLLRAVFLIKKAPSGAFF